MRRLLFLLGFRRANRRNLRPAVRLMVFHGHITGGPVGKNFGACLPRRRGGDFLVGWTRQAQRTLPGSAGVPVLRVTDGHGHRTPMHGPAQPFLGLAN